MTLKTSSRSINPFWRMFSFTLRKNLGVIIVLCIAALMYCPGSFLSVIYNANMRDDFTDYTTIFATMVAVIAGGVAVIFNTINFTFLYKKNAGDVFHAFPLTRRELLLSRTFAGVVATLIPATLCYIVFAVLTAFNPWLGNFALLALCFLNTLLIVLVCSAFSLIFVVCAGSMFDLGVSLIGVNLAIMLIGNIFTHILDCTLIGYSDNYTFGILYNLSIPYFCYSGLENGFDIIEYGINSADIEFYIRSVIYITVFAAISVLLYNYRKAEKGGTAYAYKFMYIICSVLAGICGGYIIGSLFGYEPDEIVFWIFMTLGAALSCTIYGVISHRGFKRVWRSVAMGGIAAAITALVAVIGVTGAFGYSGRVPDAQSVEKVWVDFWGENIELDNPELVITLHKSIIDKNVAEAIDDNWDNSVRFEYQLKSGKTMNRTFYITTEPVVQQLLAVYTDTKRIDKYIETVKNDQYGYIVLNYGYDQINEYGAVTLNKEQTIEFLEAYKKDLKNCDKSIFTSASLGNYDFSGGNEHSGEKGYYYFSIETYKGFTNVEEYISNSGVLNE
ncbi:MAG: hypothetical protein Q4B40_02760 [Clostridia bacterium]|nr:hypothetical protein [Clostridia bacterium]